MAEPESGGRRYYAPGALTQMTLAEALRGSWLEMDWDLVRQHRYLEGIRFTCPIGAVLSYPAGDLYVCSASIRTNPYVCSEPAFFVIYRIATPF